MVALAVLESFRRGRESLLTEWQHSYFQPSLHVSTGNLRNLEEFFYKSINDKDSLTIGSNCNHSNETNDEKQATDDVCATPETQTVVSMNELFIPVSIGFQFYIIIIVFLEQKCYTFPIEMEPVEVLHFLKGRLRNKA